MSSDPDPEFSFILRPPQAVTENGNKSWTIGRERSEAFEAREFLFNVRNPEDALRFFQSFGPWQVNQAFGTEASTIRFSGLVKRREFYEDALLKREIWSVRNTSTAEGMDGIRTVFEDYYLWQNLPLEMVFRQPPVVIAKCKDLEDAIRATVFLDRLDGFPWRRCAREDCGKVFRLGSKHAKLYCSTECAHLQSVRSYNNRKRAEAAKAASLKPKAGKTTGTTRKEGK